MNNHITTTEMHTGGEPLRIVTGGVPEIPGKTILEKRKYFSEHLDHLRTALIHEPRGHADMYGAVITEPVSPDAHFGVIFMHNEGYSTMCGHAVIALTRWAIESGRVQGNRMIIDVPSGRVEAWGEISDGVVKRSFFRNVPSFVLSGDAETEVEGLGKIRYDIAFGGAYYAILDVSQTGLDLVPASSAGLIEAGRKIKKSIMESSIITHPLEPDLGFLYGVIFTGLPQNKRHHSRNVCIFADGELDRSPTGSGVSARAALHYERGELKEGERIEIESILGTTMTVKVAQLATVGDYRAVIPEVSGRAWYTGEASFFIDPDDPLGHGFLLR